ncbi:uncharacterized protein ACRADG_007264 [Cochliomyia hominivorax]
MLRNQPRNKKLLKNLLPFYNQQPTHLVHQQNARLFNKNTNILRQGKIMGKLFGDRVSGSKKRWFPSTDSAQAASANVVFKQSQFGKPPNSGGKNATRRMTVLNKLFMKHITDLMATGEISEYILGKGLQVSRVKISQDFAYVNVYWLSSGEPGKDALLEHELQRCAGLLRHELSQLELMGVVPRIKFVKDKLYTNMHQVEALLKNMDFGPEDEDQQDEQTKHDIDYLTKHAAESLKQEFYGKQSKEIPVLTDKESKETCNEQHKAFDFNVPEMRHDVLGLDHKGIMLKILTKMRKSKQAWDQHLQNQAAEAENLSSVEASSTIPSTSFERLNKINEKLAKAAANSEKFEAFLAKRKEKRNTPERKKFNVADHHIDMDNREHNDYPDLVMSPRQRQLYEAEDYLADDVEERKYK